MFFFGSIYINKEQKIYTIKIDNNHGPKEFILDKLSKEIKSKTIGLTDERLYKYIKNELNKKQLNSNVIKSLLGDIRYAKNKNSNKKSIIKNYIDIYSVRNHLVSTKNVTELLDNNKKKLQEYDFQIDIINDDIVNIILKTSSDKTFEVYKLILFIRKNLSEYIASIQNINLIQDSGEKWITLDKGNIKYNFSYFIKYIFIFIGVIITNIVINILDQKIYTINRSRFLLNSEFDFIINDYNSNSLQNKLIQIINYNLKCNNIVFLIINSNKYILEEIKKHQKINNLKTINLVDIESISKIKFSDNSVRIFFMTGSGIHNTREILELRTFLNKNYINYKLETIYLSKRLGFL